MATRSTAWRRSSSLTSGSASDLATGTVPGARLGGAWTHPSFTGMPRAVAAPDGVVRWGYTSTVTVNV